MGTCTTIWNGVEVTLLPLTSYLQLPSSCRRPHGVGGFIFLLLVISNDRQTLEM